MTAQSSWTSTSQDTIFLTYIEGLPVPLRDAMYQKNLVDPWIFESLPTRYCGESGSRHQRESSDSGGWRRYRRWYIDASSGYFSSTYTCNAAHIITCTAAYRRNNPPRIAMHAPSQIQQCVLQRQPTHRLFWKLERDARELENVFL